MAQLRWVCAGRGRRGEGPRRGGGCFEVGETGWRSGEAEDRCGEESWPRSHYGEFGGEIGGEIGWTERSER